MFSDTVTVFHRLCNGDWEVTTVEGVQWSDKFSKTNDNGRLSVVRHAEITFPEGTYEGLVVTIGEDCIVCGKITECVSDEKGCRITDLMKKHPKSGLVQSVNDNSNRNLLKNIKVVVA